MISSFTEEARHLNNFLSKIQIEGWKVISITPIEGKQWNSTYREYVDKNEFVIIAESEKHKPTRVWVINWEEDNEHKNKVFYTEEEGKEFFIKAKEREEEGKIKRLDVWFDYNIVEV